MIASPVFPMRLTRTFDGFDHAITSIIWADSGGQLITADAGGLIRVLDGQSGATIAILRDGHAPGSAFSSISLSKDGSILAAALSEPFITLFDLSHGTVMRRLRVGQSGACQVKFSPAGHLLASGGTDGVVVIWRPPDWSRHRRFGTHQGGTANLAWSSDGKLIASCGAEDKRLRVRSIENDALILDLPEQADILCCTFSPDGRLIASGFGDGRIEIRDLQTGDVVFTTKSHVAPVVHIAFLRNRGYFMARFRDSRLKIFTTHNQRLIATIRAPGTLWREGFACHPSQPIGALLGDSHKGPDTAVRLFTWHCGNGQLDVSQTISEEPPADGPSAIANGRRKDAPANSPKPFVTWPSEFVFPPNPEFVTGTLKQLAARVGLSVPSFKKIYGSRWGLRQITRQYWQICITLMDPRMRQIFTGDGGI